MAVKLETLLMGNNFNYPNELAIAVNAQYRELIGEEDTDTIKFMSPKVLEDLFNVAYHASFLLEESRSVRFRILYIRNQTSPGGHGNRFFEFTDAKPYTAESIRKIAFAAPINTSGLVVSLQDSGLRINGIYSEGRAVEYLRKPFLSFLGFGFLPANAIRMVISKPGSIEVSSREADLATLLGGQIIIASALPSPKASVLGPVENENFLHKCLEAGERAARLRFPEGDERQRAETLAAQYLSEFLEAVLHRIRTEGHGGTLAFIDGKVRSVRYGYVRIHEEEDRILRIVADRCMLEIKRTGDPEPVEQYMILRDSWLDAVDSIAALAFVDGAVLLDYNYDVIGFNAFVDEISVEANSEFGENAGARKRSAYTLCQRNEFSTVFICSQDGDISALYSRGVNDLPDKMPVNLEQQL